MKYLFFLTSSLVFAAPALAQQQDVPADHLPDDVITVVANGVAEPVDQTGQSISVLARPEIEQVQGPDLTRVLERLPGVVFSRNGGPGGFTGVRVRGAAAEQLLVLVDGVRMDDASQPSGGFNFGNLLAGNIDKIELLRGSNSVVWGSQAVGGVMAVTTRQLHGAEASLEYGAYDSLYTTAALGGSSGGLSGALAAGYARSDGYSEVIGDPEPDGFRQWQLTGKGAAELGGGFTVMVNGRFADSRREIDGFATTSSDVQFNREASGRAALRYGQGPLELTGAVAVYDIARRYEGPDLGGVFANGRTTQAELRGRWQATDTLAVIFGAANDWYWFEDSGNDRTARQASGHVMLDYQAGPINLAGGVRYDTHDAFGGAWSFGANASLELAPGLRVRASYGEGFKVPTLYQLYAFSSDAFFTFSGNSALQPERSRSYDAGIEYGSRDGSLHLAVTLYRRDSKNLIDFVSCGTTAVGICAAHPTFDYGTYANIGRARAEGFEIEAGLRPSKRFSVQAVYSYGTSINRTPGDFTEGRDLARRPRHAVTFAADWRTPLHDLTIGGDVRLVSDSYDSMFSNQMLDGYALVTLRASLPVTDRIELFGRVENLTDAQYETAAGYSTAGRSAYGGVRARF